MNKKTVISKGISLGSLYKLLFIGLLLSLGPIIIIYGIFSLFGVVAFFWHGEAITGFDGLLVSLVMAPLFSAIIALLIWLLLAFGIWVYTRLFSLRITFKLRGNFSDY